MRSSSQAPAPRLTETDLSASDRFLAQRKAIFLRDWILALIALGLILAASVFRSETARPIHDGLRDAASLGPRQV
jgi:hypothetical protein